MSIVFVVCCGAWFCSGAMCVHILLRFKCTDGSETFHSVKMRKWFINNTHIDFSHVTIDFYQCLICYVIVIPWCVRLYVEIIHEL